MTEPDSNLDGRHPRLRMRGPNAELPTIEETPSTADLPFSGVGRDRRRRIGGPVVALAVLVLVGAIVLALGSLGDDDGPTEGASSADAGVGATGSTVGVSTTASKPPATTTEVRPTSTTAPPVATVPPVATAPPATVPVSQLPPHEAVYRDGKLILQGTLPNQAVAERFRAEAAAVIGAENVVVNYEFDSRVPEPTDGRVRVDERFLFAKESAAVDPASLPVFDLGVAVLRLNPQATMRIRGYTDARGSPELNERLSRARAQAAADYLTSKGIDPARLTVEGLGPADPVAPNETEEGRAQNRRIEVELFNLLA